jgi:hypothetical protein
MYRLTNVSAIMYCFDNLSGYRKMLCYYEGDVLLTASCFMLRLPKNSPVFESKNAFPQFPDQNSELVECPGNDVTPKQLPSEYFTEKTTNPGLKPLRLTNWSYHFTCSDILGRCLQFKNGEKVFINTALLEMIGTDSMFEEPPIVNIKGTAPDDPIVFFANEMPIAVIMPVDGRHVKPLQEAPNA